MLFYIMPLMRRKYIVRKLKACGAISPATARSFEEAGIINPHRFMRVTKVLQCNGVIKQTVDGRFYLP